MSFVVPTFRRPDALRGTLEALMSLDYPSDEYEVVVVDDGSGDATGEVVRSFVGRAARLTYLAQPNSGVATARNRGAATAEGELLIFLDDDMLVQPNHVRAHLAAREAHGDCMVNGHWGFAGPLRDILEQTPFGRYRIALEDEIRERLPKLPAGQGRFEITKVTAANLGVSAHVFHSLRGFDERFPYAGYEDQEFSHRASQAGCRFILDTHIRLDHNDARVTLDQFARRYERGAVTAVYLAALHPESHATSELLLENAGTTRHDPYRLRVKKRLKRACSGIVGTYLLRTVIKQLERCAPRSRLLPRLYSTHIGLFIFRGIREGLEQMPEAQVAVDEVMRHRHPNAEI